MFKHGKTGYTYYSVNEKINYYTAMLKTCKTADGKPISKAKEDYARSRLSLLQGLKSRSFVEPDLIVTDDKCFGDPISKPRLCVVIDADNKGRVFVAPVVERTTKSIILDGDYNRQIGDKRKWIDRSNIYETKYIYGASSLTNNDRAKIKSILRKKNNGG